MNQTVHGHLRPTASGHDRTFGTEIAPPQSGPQPCRINIGVQPIADGGGWNEGVGRARTGFSSDLVA